MSSSSLEGTLPNEASVQHGLERRYQEVPAGRGQGIPRDLGSVVSPSDPWHLLDLMEMLGEEEGLLRPFRGCCLPLSLIMFCLALEAAWGVTPLGVVTGWKGGEVHGVVVPVSRC